MCTLTAPLHARVHASVTSADTLIVRRPLTLSWVYVVLCYVVSRFSSFSSSNTFDDLFLDFFIFSLTAGSMDTVIWPESRTDSPNPKGSSSVPRRKSCPRLLQGTPKHRVQEELGPTLKS